MPTPRLVLRTCNADMSSSHGFVWPTSGKVECPDWEPTPECGNGLHGLLNGQGDASLLDWAPDAKWLVVKPGRALVVLDGKVKFKSGTVVYCGDRTGALKALRDAGVTGAVPGDTATAGDFGTATAGGYGTATAGYRGTATAGGYGTATAGYYGTATVGDDGTATAGDFGTATAGYRGTATAGYCGTATAGHYGTATVGYGGTATAGYRGTAAAGNWGAIIITWRDGDRRRLAVGYVGEDGIKPNVAYRVDDHGQFVEVDQ